MNRLIIEGYVIVFWMLLLIGLIGTLRSSKWPRLKLIWYDLWVGAYYDRAKKLFYVLPLPCLVVIFDWKKYDR